MQWELKERKIGGAFVRGAEKHQGIVRVRLKKEKNLQIEGQEDVPKKHIDKRFVSLQTAEPDFLLLHNIVCQHGIGPQLNPSRFGIRRFIAAIRLP
ncbi:hypothetical protein DQG23_38380 [Paenibacillus contaminans]|uniref:Uncharacterized protein n=1 Tax=Paenibacillus contaminans TaxID=450362 RepID=A0A329LSE3_9BACL|nr:hypothetical protein DQG23_38380 [Paenibacillus contaminans]